MARLSEKERKKRVEAVRRLMLQGENRSVILQVCAEKWSVCERAADGYIADAKQMNLESIGEKQEDLLSDAIAHRRYLRKLAHEKEDYRLELEIAKDEAQLLNLYKVVSTVLNVSVEDLMRLSDEDLKKLENGASILDVIRTVAT